MKNESAILIKTQNVTLNNLAKKPPISCLTSGGTKRFTKPSESQNATATSSSTSSSKTNSNQLFDKPQSSSSSKSSENLTVSDTKSSNPSTKLGSLADVYLNYTLSSFKQDLVRHNDNSNNKNIGITSSSAYFYNDRVNRNRPNKNLSDKSSSSLLIFDSSKHNNSNDHHHPNETYCSIDQIQLNNTTNLIQCINKSIDICGEGDDGVYDYNSSSEDIISLNVDFEEEEEEVYMRNVNLQLNKIATQKQKQQQQQHQQQQPRECIITPKLKSNSLLNLNNHKPQVKSGNNNSKNNNLFSASSLETLKLDLNPKKYTLELSTLSSTLSSRTNSSAQSIKSLISARNSSNRSSLDCYEDFGQLQLQASSGSGQKLHKSSNDLKINRKAGAPNTDSGNKAKTKTQLTTPKQQQSVLFNSVSSFFPNPSSNESNKKNMRQLNQNRNSINVMLSNSNSNINNNSKPDIVDDDNYHLVKAQDNIQSASHTNLISNDQFEKQQARPQSVFISKNSSNQRKCTVNDLKKKDEQQQQAANSKRNSYTPNLNKNFWDSSAVSLVRHINSLDEHLLVKIFSKINTMDKLIAQFVCKKWHRIMHSSQNTYMLFNTIEIVGARDISFIHAPPAPPLPQPPPPPLCRETAQTPNQTSNINISRFFRTSSHKKCPSTHLLQTEQQQVTDYDLSPKTFRTRHANIDHVLKYLLTKFLNKKTYPVCLCVESIIIRDSSRLTDKGVELIASYCPELKYISLCNCVNLKNTSVQRLVELCHSLKFIDLAGCYNVSNLISNSLCHTNNTSNNNNNNNNYYSANNTSCVVNEHTRSLFSFKLNDFYRKFAKTPGSNSMRKEVSFNISNYFYLQYVDLSYCLNVDDACLKNVCKSCVFIKNLYLRRCRLITDMSLVYVAKYCANLRELSLCECSRITDTGIRYLADERLILGNESNYPNNATALDDLSLMDWVRLKGSAKTKDEQYLNYRKMKEKFHIKYLSLAKCELVTDKSLVYLCKAGFFEHIKYLNLRGCVQVTDRFMKYFTCSHILTNQLLSTNSIEFVLNLNLSVPMNLKSLDLSKCSVTDKSIDYLCRLAALRPGYELSKLNLRACINLTDNGVKTLALNFKNLQGLNIVGCTQISDQALRDIKFNCKCCIIQHTIFSFC